MSDPRWLRILAPALCLVLLGCPDDWQEEPDDDTIHEDDDATGDDDATDDDDTSVGDDDDTSAGDDDDTSVGDDDDTSVGDDDDTSVGDDDDTSVGDDDDTMADSAPQAAIAATPATGNAPLPVMFQGVVAGGDPPLTFAWNFGDGATATTQDPPHEFTNPGSYAVTFEVTDVDGDFDSATTTIAVGSDNPADAYPALSINAVPTSGNIPLTVAFSAAVSGGDQPLSFDWDFGDGNTSTDQNPVHLYTTAGTYPVRCEVTDDTGDTDDQILTVVAYDPGSMPTDPELSGALVDTEWVNVATNAAEIYEPNNRSLWAYDFIQNEGLASSYRATGWLDPNGEMIYTVDVTNAGIDTPSLFWVDIYWAPASVPAPSDPGVGDAWDSVWGLGGGDTETLSFVWSTPPDVDEVYESYVVIDAEEQVAEGDETDNVIGPIDAWVRTDWDWYEVYLFTGDTLDLYLEVPPNGALDFDLDLYGPDALFDAVSYGNATEDEQITFVADQEGPWWIRIYTNYSTILSADPGDYYVLDVTIY